MTLWNNAPIFSRLLLDDRNEAAESKNNLELALEFLRRRANLGT